MFVTTFYSYKGGVGRTMALANVASEMSRRGKSVLVADFDLEAPGLSSFAFNGSGLHAADRVPGLVDFIHYWLDHERTPDIRDFVCKQDDDDPSHGPIHVMPAGKMDETYGSRLHQIDFEALYRERDGYLMFEDIRAQWEKVLKVNYILIDSRTGHTDIGGICTRQLPNLIAFVFWPNIQNLNGLTSIVKEIDEQDQETSRDIQRLYVPLNLPLLDDERDVLRGLLGRFRTALSYEPSDEVQIHNYPSLDLLEQTIFTRERPKSRLAREYRSLTDAITSKNLSDVRGVKLFLAHALESEPGSGSGRWPSRSSTFAPRIESQLSRISAKKWDDSEINRFLALAKAREGDLTEAIRLLESVVAKGDDTLPDHLFLAQFMIATGTQVDPLLTVNRLLDDEESTQAHVIAALRLLSRSQTQVPEDVDVRPAIQRLSPRELGRVADALNSDRTQAQLASRIISSAMKRDKSAFLGATDSSAALAISLVLIGGGRFDEALVVLETASSGEDGLSRLRVLFNSAMAAWGSEGSPRVWLFEDSIKLHEELGAQERGANYNQCIGLALAVLGRKDDALETLGRARILVERQHSTFSCWSYLERGELGFAQDIDEIRSWIDKGEPTPAVFRENDGNGGESIRVMHHA